MNPAQTEADASTDASSSNALSSSTIPSLSTADESANTVQPNSFALNHTQSLSATDLEGFGVVGTDPFGLTDNLSLALLLIFLAGLTLAFTPCILPMLPIVANIVAGQEKPTARRSFMLSFSYALGVATAYGLLGALIAYLGESSGLLGALQNPIILAVFAILFVALGLYMLEVINIRLPNAISQPLHRMSQAGNHRLGSAGGSYLVGLLSALVVSPCVSAPLFGVLVAVASIGSLPIGFIALFTLGIGLSLPLVVFATTEGKLLPQAGEWMNWVKQGFAYLMFAVALMMIERIFQHPLILVMWAVWFVLMAWWAWRFSSHIGKVASLVAKLFAVVAMVWAGVLTYGATQGATDSLQPLSGSQKRNQAINIESVLAGNTELEEPIKIHTLDELDDILQKEPKVLVDLVADWCIECRIMEKDLFVTPPEQMKGWQVVKLDITEPEHSKPALTRYELVGPPTLLYYKKGQLLTRQVGQVERGDFEQLLEVLNKQAD